MTKKVLLRRTIETLETILIKVQKQRAAALKDVDELKDSLSTLEGVVESLLSQYEASHLKRRELEEEKFILNNELNSLRVTLAATVIKLSEFSEEIELPSDDGCSTAAEEEMDDEDFSILQVIEIRPVELLTFGAMVERASSSSSSSSGGSSSSSSSA